MNRYIVGRRRFYQTGLEENFALYSNINNKQQYRSMHCLCNSLLVGIIIPVGLDTQILIFFPQLLR